MFGTLTVRKQLQIGFGAILLLLIVSAFINGQVLSNTNDSFDRYREMARDANLMGRVQANLLLARTSAKDYFFSSRHEDVLTFEHYYERMRKFVEVAQVEINDPERAKSVDQIDDDTRRYYQSFSEVVKYTELRNSKIRNELDINGHRIEQVLATLVKDSHQSNMQDQGNIGEVTSLLIHHFLLGRINAIKFLNTSEDRFVEESLEQFDQINQLVNKHTIQIKQNIFNERVNKVALDIKQYEQTLLEIQALTQNRNNVINILNELGPAIAQLAEDLKLEIKSVQDTLGPQMVERNENSFISILSLSSFLIIITLIIAIRIPHQIVSSLESLQDGVISFLAFLRQEKDDVEPITIRGENEFSVLAEKLNENFIIAQEAIHKNEIAEQERTDALREMAITDGLTGVYNRRYFDELAEAAFNSAKRLDNYLILFILDIDFFKPYNDYYGHMAGDNVLQTVAEAIRDHLKRKDDLVFRIGGEEFGAVTTSKPEDLEQNLHYIKQLISLIEGLQIPHAESKVSDFLTASVGIRIVDPSSDQFVTLDQAYTEADNALYLAKSSGRNRSQIFTSNTLLHSRKGGRQRT